MRFFSAHLIIFLSIALTLAAPITESHRSRDLGHAKAESLALVKRVLGDDDPIPSGSGSGWKNRLGAVVRLGRGKQGVQQLPNDPNTSTNNPITGGVNTTPTPFTVPPPTGPPAAGPLTINVNPAVLAAGNAARNNRIRPNSPTSAVAGSPNVDKPLPPLPRPALRVANPDRQSPQRSKSLDSGTRSRSSSSSQSNAPVTRGRSRATKNLGGGQSGSPSRGGSRSISSGRATRGSGSLRSISSDRATRGTRSASSSRAGSRSRSPSSNRSIRGSRSSSSARSSKSGRVSRPASAGRTTRARVSASRPRSKSPARGTNARAGPSRNTNARATSRSRSSAKSTKARAASRPASPARKANNNKPKSRSPARPRGKQ